MEKQNILQIRNLEYNEYKIIHDWALKQEHWNLGLHDDKAYKAFDNKWSFIGTIDKQPIGAIAAMQYNDNLAMIGWFIVKNKFQKLGYGKQILNKCLQSFKAKTIGLDASLSQVKYYEKYGFKTYAKTNRHYIYGTKTKYCPYNIIPCQKLSIQMISNYDYLCFGIRRKQFIETWLNLPGSISIAYMRNNTIKGYGVLRKIVQGYRIGPLYADSFDIAQQLIKVFQGKVTKTDLVQFDILNTNENLQKIKKSFNTKIRFSCVRMYLGPIPINENKKKIYCITAMEFA